MIVLTFAPLLAGRIARIGVRCFALLMKIRTYKRTSAGTQAAWLMGAVLLGFSASAVFADLLYLPRNTFLLPNSLRMVFRPTD